MRYRCFQWLVFVILAGFLTACGSAPDEEVPDLTLNLPDTGILEPNGVLRTNEDTLAISGTVEAGATLQVSTTAEPDPRIVEPGELDEEGRLTWSTEIALTEKDGANRISVSAFDRIGNTRIIHRTIVRDTAPPQISNWWYEDVKVSVEGGGTEDSIVLVMVFDEVVKVDTLVKEDGETFIFTDAVEVVIPGVLEPDIKEGEQYPEYWRSFTWSPEHPWTPGGQFSFVVPAGIADDLGNISADQIRVIYPEKDEDELSEVE